MKPVILMRTSLAEEQELSVAKKYFEVYESRSKIPVNSTVIGRYSVLPYYFELETDVKNMGSELINSYQQHFWIADMKEWYQDFCDITPKTWFRLEDIPLTEKGPFVLKGCTNSKKFHWNSHMFAKTRVEAVQVYSKLTTDSLISEQDIYIRKYVPLKKLAEGINGLPISEEYRIFFLDGKIIASGFYWASHVDDIDITTKENLTLENVPKEFLETISNRLKDKARFVVVDVARTDDNDWTVIEINDGQMSGLSTIVPEQLYRNLSLSFQHV